MYQQTNSSTESNSFEFLFEQPKPSFNFSVGLLVFYSGNDVIDDVQVKEFLERMVGEITIPDRYELDTVVGQDLVRSSVFTESGFRTEMAFSVVGESNIPKQVINRDESSMKATIYFFDPLNLNSFQSSRQSSIECFRSNRTHFLWPFFLGFSITN